MNSKQPIRAAVVGGGAFGECHLKTLRAMPQVEVAGLYTLERERGAALCHRYGGNCYQSLEELASDPTIGLVTIATPENAHFEAFKLLAAKKKRSTWKNHCPFRCRKRGKCWSSLSRSLR